MARKGLSDFLGTIRDRPILFPDFSAMHPKALTAAVEELRTTIGNVVLSPPTPFDLEETHNTVSKTWQSDHTLDAINRRSEKLIPWILFYPPLLDDSWLGADKDFSLQYIDALSKRPRSSSVAAVTHVFLKHYPQDIPTFDLWRRSIGGLLLLKSTLRLREWQRRASKYDLLADGADGSFSQKLLTNTSNSIDETLQDAGLTDDLSRSEFLTQVYNQFLSNVHERLHKDACEDGDLDKTFEFSTVSADRLRYPDKSRLLIDYLLLPFTKRDPEKHIKDRIQKFLLHHFQDPRIHPSNWQGANEKSIQVMNRWLVGLTLADFFKFLKRAAEIDSSYQFDRHWHYRQAFWSAYLRGGHITDAWVVLGKRARKIARTLFSGKVENYAKLESGDGALPNHSVLIMKVGGLTVTEWSHNGACRLWARDSNDTPKLYKSSYSRWNLMQNADYRQVHHSSEYGTWQMKLSGAIRSHTGISISLSDLMPGTNR